MKRRAFVKTTSFSVGSALLTSDLLSLRGFAQDSSYACAEVTISTIYQHGSHPPDSDANTPNLYATDEGAQSAAEEWLANASVSDFGEPYGTPTESTEYVNCGGAPHEPISSALDSIQVIAVETPGFGGGTVVHGYRWLITRTLEDIDCGVVV